MSDDTKPARLEIVAAENGGYVVRDDANLVPGLKNTVLGAYTSAADLIEAMPEILGTDGIKVTITVERDYGEFELHTWPKPPDTFTVQDPPGIKFPYKEEPLRAGSIHTGRLSPSYISD